MKLLLLAALTQFLAYLALLLWQEWGRLQQEV